MKDNQPHCLLCQHFHRDFNRYQAAEFLEGCEIGYCMCQPPRPYFEELTEAASKTLVSIFPLVDEDAVCGSFTLRNEESTKR